MNAHRPAASSTAILHRRCPQELSTGLLHSRPSGGRPRGTLSPTCLASRLTGQTVLNISSRTEQEVLDEHTEGGRQLCSSAQVSRPSGDRPHRLRIVRPWPAPSTSPGPSVPPLPSSSPPHHTSARDPAQGPTRGDTRLNRCSDARVLHRGARHERRRETPSPARRRSDEHGRACTSRAAAPQGRGPAAPVSGRPPRRARRSRRRPPDRPALRWSRGHS